MLLLGIAIALSATVEELPQVDPNELRFTTSSLRGIGSRFLAEQVRAAPTTCDKNPTVCKSKGSAGPNCCSKKCVNIRTDTNNCGRCGAKCKYSELCCNGVCVNPSVNGKHCGKCGNKCGSGSSCVFGLCSYAN
ncbi:hypothetical protein ACLB2K_027686 [Fragaria x ananassa]